MSDERETEGPVEVIVPRSAAAARLDAYLAGAGLGLSRSRVKTLILDGQVTVDGTTVFEPKRPVAEGQRITVDPPPPEPAAPLAEEIPLEIVYEDIDLIVIDKPAGLVVHPAAGNQTGTLVNALIAHCGSSLSGIGGVSRPGIVHRLDKDTSGLLVVAKNDLAHRSLAAQFADHGKSGQLERGYRTLVWGAPARAAGTIDAPLGRSTRNREKVEVKRERGRLAVTHYRVEARYGFAGKQPVAALVECRLETGRTHQIRVHLASIGHPIIGDSTYGAGFATKAALLPEPARGLAASFPRQALHAYLLGFVHPRTGETLRFESTLPADMANLSAALASL